MRRNCLPACAAVLLATIGATAIADPAFAPPLPPPPSVVPFVACVHHIPNGDVVWFGYRDRAAHRVRRDAGSGNTLSVLRSLRFNQTVEFHPGEVSRAFSVHVPTGGAARWALTVPRYDTLTGDFVNSSVWPEAIVSATNDAATPLCAARTGIDSATPQYTTQFPGISYSIASEFRDHGKLTRASLKFAVPVVTSKCSTGGIALSPSVLWGYAPPISQFQGTFMRAAPTNYVPPPSSQIIRTDTFPYLNGIGTVAFKRSRSDRVSVGNPQRVWRFGSTPEERQRNPQPLGFSGARVIADVQARCSFAGVVKTSATELWIDASGRGFNTVTVTDALTQSTRTVRLCPNPLPPPPVTTCDVPTIGIGPGGPRFR